MSLYTQDTMPSDILRFPVTCHLCPVLPLVTHHLSLVTALSFLGGTANPEGVRQGTHKAEARRAASAQAAFPYGRASEKKVPEKDNRIAPN
jgi:hypothetical protein